MIKKETFEKLKPYEQRLYTGGELGYVRGLYSNVRKELSDIYKEIFNEEPDGLRGGCSSCGMRAIKKLWNEYKMYKDRYYGRKTTDNTKG